MPQPIPDLHVGQAGEGLCGGWCAAFDDAGQARSGDALRGTLEVTHRPQPVVQSLQVFKIIQSPPQVLVTCSTARNDAAR